jgi:AcrR family transcriptional regulator
MPDSTTKRRAHHHGNLREALIAAAVQCVEVSGMHGLTLREVARAAGVSHQAPYHHFPDRASLVAAVAETGFRRLHERLSRAITRAEASADARLDALVLAYVRFAVEERTLFRVMFDSAVADKSGYPSLQSIADANTELLTTTIADAQQSGRVAAGSIADYATATWALAHGLSCILVDGQLRHRGYSASTSSAVARRLFGILREGLKAR